MMISATRQPSQGMITALQRVTFTCEAKGFMVMYEWKRHRNSNVIGRQSTLTISRATPSNEDQYYCVAMTEGGYAFSNNVTLTVDGENNNVMCIIILINLTDYINIRMQPKDVTVAKGNKVDLSINARGPGRNVFTYQWKKVGSDSLPDTASGGNSTQLTITSISPSDRGMYYCIVMNQWGNMVQSDNAVVNVLRELMCYVS